MEQRICRVCGDAVTPKHGMWPERCDPCRRKRDFLPGSKTYQLACSVCGAGFIGGHVHAMYCSRACCKKANRKTLDEMACEVCGSRFVPRRTGKRFCSRTCVNRAKSARVKPQPYDMKVCKCGALRSHSVRCPRCERLRRAKAKAAKAMALPTNKPWTCGPCVVCGSPFVCTQPALVCSKRCQRRRINRSQRAKYGPDTNRKRARLNGCFYEVVNRRKVFERDGYRCGICGGQTDPTVKVPHHNAPTLDHIVPMALGGAHAYRNVQCAHFDCNWDKKDSLPTLSELIAA